MVFSGIANYGTCACFASINYGPRTAVAGVVGGNIPEAEIIFRVLGLRS